MKPKPYITIDAFTDEHAQWIIANVKSNVIITRRYRDSGKCVGRDASVPYLLTNFRYTFNDPKEAMLFKLTWGGQA